MGRKKLIEAAIATRPVGSNNQSVALIATDRECVISNPWFIMLVGGNIVFVALIATIGGNSSIGGNSLTQNLHGMFFSTEEEKI